MPKCPRCGNSFSDKDQKVRSVDENKYYWGVVVEIMASELGNDKDTMHEVLKSKFLSELVHVKGKDGMVREYTIVRSTANLTVPRFEKYLTEIRIWASAEMNIFIPLPNEEVKQHG